MLFANLKIKTKLLALMIIFLSGILVISLFFSNLFNKTKVDGQIYNDIMLDKDLVADILPPPEYIIESYLTVLQITVEKDNNKIEQFIKHGEQLENEYQVRHEYWVNTLPEGQIRELMVVEAHRYATEFYDIRDKKLLPALLSGQRDKAEQYLIEMKDAYDKQRGVIDQIVDLTNRKTEASQAELKSVIRSGIFQMISLILTILIISILFFTSSVFLSQSQ